MDVVERVARICRRDLDERRLRVDVLAAVRATIPFDAYAWLLADPATGVGWSPVADVPVLGELPDVIRHKYLTTVNRWTALEPGVAVTLVGATEGDLSRSLLWRVVQSAYGVSDVALVVLRDPFGCWGFLDLWRRGGVFSSAEVAALGAVAATVTSALRRALLQTFAAAGPEVVSGPVVLLLDDDLRPVAQTPATGDHLAALLPAEAGRAVVPAAAYNVAAQLAAVEADVDERPPRARIYVAGRSWMTIRAARIDAPGPAGAAIAVSIDTAAAAERSDLYAAVAGLTAREADVLECIVEGCDTRHAARRLAISEHTVQDHLKSIFAKTGTDSRRLLTARATGTTR